MDYLDFYDLCIYANENWRGGFSDRENAENAYIYKSEYDAQGTESSIIKNLIFLLITDNTDESLEWVRKLRNEV